MPADALAVVVNLTAVKSSQTASLAVYDADLANAPMPYSSLVMPAGQVRSNTAFVGLSVAGTIAVEAGLASPSDTAHLIVDVLGYLAENGAIQIVKRTNGQDANSPPGPSIPPGSSVSWTYTVSNIGAVRLSNISVTDDQGVAGACPKTSLQPGESMNCVASGTAVACQYGNIGKVTGATAPCGGSQVTAEDPSHYFGIPCS